MTAPAPVPFALACGQLRPLRLAVEHLDGGRIAEGELDQPHALIGSAAGCDIVLNHPDVAERVACLQVLDGQVYVIELSGTAIHRLTPESPFVVGPFTLRLFESPSDGPAPRVGDPLRDRVSDREWPRVRLTSGDATPREIDRRLTFLGRRGTPRSVEVADPWAYLTLTRDGVFVVDLLAAGTRVNAESVRVARLADGDELSVGHDTYTVTVGGSDPAWDLPASVGRLSEALLGGLPLGDADADEQLVPLVATPSSPVPIPVPANLDPDLVAILKQAGSLRTQLLDQFRRTVDGMLADFANLRREQLVALRDEMARMSEVTGQLDRLRDRAGITQLPPLPVEERAASESAADAGPGVSEETAAVHLAVYDRLTVLGRERPGLWKRLRSLLGGRSDLPG